MSPGSLMLSFLGCFAFLFCGPVSADADGPDYFAVTGVQAEDHLNLRSDPSASGALVGTVPHDATGIANLGCIGGLTYAEWAEANEVERATAAKTRWCRVGYDRTIGWAAGWFLTEGATPDAFRAGSILREISGSEWLLRDFAGEPARAEAWLSFKPDNAFMGNGGCNNFRGNQTAGADGALFLPVAATKKMCPEVEMETEVRFFQVLEKTREIVAYHLLMALFDDNGQLLATFTRRDPD